MPSSHGAPSFWSTPPWHEMHGAMLRSGSPTRTSAGSGLVVGRRRGARLRQGGVVGREVGDVARRTGCRASASMIGLARLPRLVVVQLLDDDLRVLPREVGRVRPRSCPARRGTSCSCSASVAPRPTASLAPARAIAALEHDARRRWPALRGRAAGRPSSAGTPAARQMLAQRPCAREVALHRRQPDEARRGSTATVSTTSDDDAPAHPRVAPGTCGVARHHRLPIGMTGTDVSLSERELHDRVAVVHDRQRRSSSPPTGRSRSAPPACARRRCAARLNVNGAGAAALAPRARRGCRRTAAPRPRAAARRASTR